MGLIDVEIIFRVPEGEELTDERLEALNEIGFDENSVSSGQPGRVTLMLSLERTSWEREAESRAEDLLEILADADLHDIRSSS